MFQPHVTSRKKGLELISGAIQGDINASEGVINRLTLNMEGLQQGANFWEHSRTMGRERFWRRKGVSYFKHGGGGVMHEHAWLPMKLTTAVYWWRKNHKQAATKCGCSKQMVKHLQGGNSGVGDVHGLQTSDPSVGWLMVRFKLMLSPWKRRYSV